MWPTSISSAENAENVNENNAGEGGKERGEIEDRIAKLSIGKGGEINAGEEEFTPDEAEALKRLLAADESVGEASCEAGKGESTEPSEPGDKGEGESGSRGAEAKSVHRGTGGREGHRHPRLERQVFVGGLPVDVTGSLFRAWAEKVFKNRVINAVLVRILSVDVYYLDYQLQ
jgi:hypothetical protein